MSTQIIQEASRLPRYGAVIDWSFCNAKESYLAFVAEWKRTYKWLSLDLRQNKLEHRSRQSGLAVPQNPKAVALRKAAEAIGLTKGDIPLWFRIYGGSATPSGATWLCELRVEAKKHAAEAWKAAHPAP